LRVEFVTSDRYLDLTKGEADVALRSGDTDDELVGRKIADSIWAVYGSRAYLQDRAPPRTVEELSQHPLVAFDGTMARHRASTWLAEVAPNATIAARNNSVLGLVYAVKSGLGLGALPTALGDAEGDLLRVLGPILHRVKDRLPRWPISSARRTSASTGCRATSSIPTGTRSMACGCTTWTRAAAIRSSASTASRPGPTSTAGCCRCWWRPDGG